MSHSKDLRQRAIKYVEQGGSIKEACTLFEVSRSSFQRWRNLKTTTGSLTPKSRTKSPYKIDNEELKAYINTHPDAYLYPSPLKVLENFSEIDYKYRYYEISATQ